MIFHCRNDKKRFDKTGQVQYNNIMEKSIWFNLLFFAIGLVLIIKGGDYFVNSAVAFAKKTKIPTVIIGATIVSIATTLPELIVSSIAAYKGDFGMAVGNGVGSVIANTALICGLSIACLPSIVKKDSVARYLTIIFCAIFLIVASLNFQIELYESIILIVLFVAFMVINVLDAKKKKGTQDESQIEGDAELVSLGKIIPLFILGALAIAFGAMTLVDSASNLAKMIGISDEIIGLTVVALGTSLPELTTTLISIKKKESALGYGNIIGANIINLTLLVGLSGVLSGSGLPISKESVFLNLPLMLVVIFIFVLPLLFKSRTYRWQGVSMLCIYLAYMVYLVLTALNVVSLF